jgi:tRNA (guanine37-N1)-methyltransferase
MRIDVLTLFPEVIQPYVTASIIGRAQASGIVEIHTHQLREYSNDPHKKVDDRPFGGGPGMVLMCQPVVDAVQAIEAQDSRATLRVLLTPQGRKFDQEMASRFAKCERLVFICGHYEGFDERIVDVLRPEEVSLGDFVMTGGEIAALAMIDSVVRLLPGALGHEDAAANESFQNDRLDCPHYTRPREFQGLSVPEVLLSGNHAEIEKWRSEQSTRRTQERRPDLLDGANAAHRNDAAMGAELRAGGEVEIQACDGEGAKSYRGIVISRRGVPPLRTSTIRRVSQGDSGERIVPLHVPTLFARRIRPHRMRRSKLNYLRQRDEAAMRRRLAEMAVAIEDLLNLIRQRKSQE